MKREEMVRIKEERGYSYKKLSEYTGVPVVTLQKVFSGATARPRKSTMAAIERVLCGDESLYQGKTFTYSTGRQPSADMVRESTPAYQAWKKQGEYTLEDYYALPDDQRVELIDGVFFEMNSPRTVHQDIASIIHMALYDYIRKNKKPCKVFEAAVDVQLCCDNKTMVQPDVLVVCDREKIKGFGIYGAPDFILEILSKSTRNKDMTIKLSKYIEAGVREYWIIDPYKKLLITYDLTDEDFIPVIHQLNESVPVAITGGDLQIDLTPVAESIEELGNLE